MFMKRISLQYLFFLWIVCAQNVDVDRPVVSLTHGGRVRGQGEQVTVNGKMYKVNGFLGIPFAKPPVGKRRFAPPEAHEGWSGILNATTLPNTCWQYIFSGFDQANAGARMWANNTQMSEDCLYLNVWSPTITATSKLPVMIWIYGGGFTSGTSTLEVYNGAILAATQNVVVVSMQYRLGAFGFIRLQPQTDFTSHGNIALGNQGLLDQLLALKWVNTEIASFGGDPNSVTLFGESSGAVSVSAHWISPIAQPYFQRAIIQSGSIIARWGIHELEQAHHRAAVFAEACGCPDPRVNRDASVDCLQAVDPLVLVEKLDAIAEDIGVQRNSTLWKNLWQSDEYTEDFSGKPFPGWATSSRRYFDVPFGAVVDGTYFPKHPRELLQTPSLLKTAPQMLIGINQDEAIYFLIYGLSLRDTQFYYENGTLSMPQSMEIAGQRQSLSGDSQMADFHWITAIQILDEKYLFPGLSKLPAMFYDLPMKVNSTNVYADPNQIKLTAEQLMQRLNDLASDVDFVCPTLEFADLVARLPQASVYMYLFRQPTESMPWPKWTGVMHGYEIQYTFGMPHSQKFQQEFFAFTEQERKFSDQMMQIWSDFAKTGDPNKNLGQVRWPVYRTSSQKQPNQQDYFILDVNMKPASGLREKECAFWLHELENLAQVLQKGSAASKISIRYISYGVTIACMLLRLAILD